MAHKANIVAMLLAGGQGSRLGVLTKNIAKPAVPYGGNYRIIDFPLSNCVNSGIYTVGVLTQYQPLELNDYIGYRNLCTVAKSLKDTSGVSGYSVYGISRPENMDVWLGEDVKDFSGDPTGYWLPSASGTVLMMKTSELSEGSTFSRSLGNIHGVESGDYTLFVLKGEPGD